MASDLVSTLKVAKTLLAGASAGALMLALTSSSWAQETTAPADPAATETEGTTDQAAPAEGESSERLVVTGSRFPRPNLEQPTPVSEVSRARIENAGTANLGDTLAQLPALSSNGTVRANSDSFADAGGLNFPDLRSLGTGRTLTLINGKRHVGGDAGDTAVDFNSIPSALVERIEVITGGASAIYGSDAVTGVINVILKDDFEGVEINLEGGTPDDGDFAQYGSGYLTAGTNFGPEDNGNITLTAFFDKTTAATAKDLYPALQNYGSAINPADTGPNDGIPDLLIVPNIVSEWIDENAVLVDFGTFGILTGFDAAGNPVAVPPRTLENSFAFGVVPGCTTCFDLEDWILVVPETERIGFASTFKYDFSPAFGVYGEIKGVKTEIEDYVQPSFSFFEYALEPDNAYITPDIQDILDTAVGPVVFNRFNGDIGARRNSITRETTRFVVGAKGAAEMQIFELNWDLSYVWGETSNEFYGTGSLIPGNYAAAIDAVDDGGTIRCRVDVPAAQYLGWVAPTGMTGEPCVPFNIFGQQNSAEAIDYVSHEQTRKHTITQSVLTGVATFDTGRFLTLQGGAIDMAFGFEYREEDSENINDPFVKSGLSETAPQPDAFGGFDVYEAFFEFNAPLLEGVEFADILEVDAAIRVADYSHAGYARAWKVGGIYGPIEGLRFRGTYSEAVRAPNITEAFLPPTAGFFDIDDPCDDAVIGDDPDRAANCTALGMPPGFNAIDNAGVEGLASGNQSLTPEEAESWTIGVVLEPDFLPGFSLTLDRYNIEITDAIVFIDPQDAAENCVDASGAPDPVFCSLITRDPGDFNIVFVESSYVNASKLTTKGWDLQIAYATNLADLTADTAMAFLDGDVAVSLTANKLDELRIFAFQSDPTNENVEEGEIGDPEWSFVTDLSYRMGDLTLIWRSRYEDEVSRFAQGAGSPEDYDYPYIEYVWTHDFVARYNLEAATGADAEIYVGVNNAFDEEYPYGLGSSGTAAAYDIVGRYVFGGATLRF